MYKEYLQMYFLVEEKYGIAPPFTKEHFVISVELLVKDNFISKKYTDRINSGDLFFCNRQSKCFKL